MSWRDEPKRWYSVSKCGCARTSTNHPLVVNGIALSGELVHICDPHKPRKETSPMTTDLDRKARELTPREAVEVLAAYQDWRNGTSSTQIPPAIISDAINTVIDSLRLAVPYGWVLVPVRLSAEQVSAVKDMVADEYGMYSIYARPLWANLLKIVAGLTIDYQEAVNEQRALAAAPTLADEGEKPSQAPLPPFGKLGPP